MIRTKDLLWFVLVLVFLALAILSTFVNRPAGSSGILNMPPIQSNAPEYSAELADGGGMDRDANIERLRALLSEGDLVTSSPSVEDEVFDELEEILRGELECGPVDSGIATARLWPLSGVTVNAAEGMRVVVYTQAAAAAPAPVPVVGTSTSLVPAAPPAIVKTLLVLSQFPVKATQPTCLDSEIVGVTVDGSLIFNNDVILYRNTAPNTLIGYARDGFPIYGAYAGPVDECGGYDGPGGYRYVALGGESKFMKCFVGAPSAFTP